MLSRSHSSSSRLKEKFDSVGVVPVRVSPTVSNLCVGHTRRRCAVIFGDSVIWFPACCLPQQHSLGSGGPAQSPGLQGTEWVYSTVSIRVKCSIAGSLEVPGGDLLRIFGLGLLMTKQNNLSRFNCCSLPWIAVCEELTIRARYLFCFFMVSGVCMLKGSSV